MMNAERERARWRKRRIIYNNDGDDVIETRPDGVEHEHDVAESLTVRRTGDTVQDFLDARSTPLIGSQVDSNWFASAMAGVRFSHHTKLGGFHGKGIPLELVEKYGRDALQIQLDFSREHGMEAAWCLRMNDVHDSFPMGSRRYTYGLAKFKRDNPGYMMGQEGDWEKYGRGSPRCAWTRLDFAVPKVREHIFNIIEEVAENYDVDLIGMEFFKYWPFFRESLELDPVEPEHVEIMNDLLRRIRRMADDVASRRGRPLLLAAHTPFSLEDCVHVGVDLETWLQEGLIDQRDFVGKVGTGPQVGGAGFYGEIGDGPDRLHGHGKCRPPTNGFTVKSAQSACRLPPSLAQSFSPVGNGLRMATLWRTCHPPAIPHDLDRLRVAQRQSVQVRMLALGVEAHEQVLVLQPYLVAISRSASYTSSMATLVRSISAAGSTSGMMANPSSVSCCRYFFSSRMGDDLLAYYSHPTRSVGLVVRRAPRRTGRRPEHGLRGFLKPIFSIAGKNGICLICPLWEKAKVCTWPTTGKSSTGWRQWRRS